MSTAQLKDRSGQVVQLGAELARGGEGVVFDVRGRSDVVAKLYHQAPSAARVAKLDALVQVCTKQLRSTTAWPQDVLYDRPGRTAGFLMPRLSGLHDLHVVYGPRTRLRTFPDASWRFLVRTAANLARAFAAVHREGHVIGDVNDRLALVSTDALVHLVDCDSFQIRHAGKLYTCDVGIPLYQPPELQKVSSFRGLERTPEYDRFGLAVLIFQLLFLARHPFAGTYFGPGEMPIEAAIGSFLFAYGRNAAAKKIKPPPASLSLSVLDNNLDTLFERAFAPDAPRRGRPTADDWSAALSTFEGALKVCPRNPNHALKAGLLECPICGIEQRAGVALFGFPAPSRRPETIDVRALWSAITAIAPPGSWPPDPDRIAASRPLALSELGQVIRKSRRRSIYIRVALIFIALLSTSVAAAFSHAWFAALGALLPVIGWRRTRIDTCEAWQISSAAFDQADQQIADLRQRWCEGTSIEQFEKYERELRQAKNTFEQLSVERARRIAALEKNGRADQLDDFLDSHRLARADIQGIGPARKTTLESYGIETAADVVRAKVAAVPGFGEALTDRMLKWRRDVEARFVFDPQRAIDPRKIDQLDRELELQRRAVVRTLSEGPERLRRIKAAIEQRRSVLMQVFVRAAADRDQARCDLGMVPPT